MLHNLERLTVPKYCSLCGVEATTADTICAMCGVGTLYTVVFSAIDGRRLDDDPEPAWAKEERLAKEKAGYCSFPAEAVEDDDLPF